MELEYRYLKFTIVKYNQYNYEKLQRNNSSSRT